MIKLNTKGDTLWTHSYKESIFDEVTAINGTRPGQMILTGFGDSIKNCQSTDGVTFKVGKADTSSEIQWTKSIERPIHFKPVSIKSTTDGGYILTGSSILFKEDKEYHWNYDYLVMKLDSNGNTIWPRTLGGSDRDKAKDVIECQDGGFIVTGISDSRDGDIKNNRGGFDAWLVKIDASGNVCWTRSVGGFGSDEAHALHRTNDGGFVMVGSTSSREGDLLENMRNSQYLRKVFYDGTIHSKRFNSKYWVVKFENTKPASSDQFVKTTFNWNDTILYTDTYRLLNIDFPSNQEGIVSLNTVNKHIFDDFFRFMKRNPKASVIIAVHAPVLGSDLYESRIQQTQLRASMIKSVLMSRGIDGSRIVARGYGNRKPVVNHDELEKMSTIKRKKVDEQKNQRIQVIIMHDG